ncbi:MAG: right-handed parallel beta-helix repeat-containing protein [Acidobacteriota bacterium]|nr:right-handed parallel beta-helix repeat-containing protein [Acidobacteriota bacterium]
MAGNVRTGIFAIFLLTALAFAYPISANHPVLVEGEKDFDNDGIIGLAEDNDGDLVFGTINAALGSALGAAAQNGRVTIVTSGRFAETVTINGAGNVTLEAAPGVEANIDAVVTGTRANDFPGGTNVSRQGAPGIVVNSSNPNRYIVLRNLVSRNWTEGILVTGSSRVTIDNCRLENNVNYGVLVQGAARVAITNTQVNGTGFRIGAAGQSPVAAAGAVQVSPMPGTGIEYESGSGHIADTVVTGSFAVGIDTGGASVELTRVIAFDNGSNFGGPGNSGGTPASGGPCPAGQPSAPKPASSWVPSQDCSGWVPPDHPGRRR